MKNEDPKQVITYRSIRRIRLPLLDCGVHLNQVMAGIRDLEEGTTDRRKHEKPASENPVDVEAVSPLLRQIAELLESDLVEAMNCLESLRKHSGNSPDELLVRVNTHLIEMQCSKDDPCRNMG